MDRLFSTIYTLDWAVVAVGVLAIALVAFFIHANIFYWSRRKQLGRDDDFDPDADAW